MRKEQRASSDVPTQDRPRRSSTMSFTSLRNQIVAQAARLEEDATRAAQEAATVAALAGVPSISDDLTTDVPHLDAHTTGQEDRKSLRAFQQGCRTRAASHLALADRLRAEASRLHQMAATLTTPV